MDWFASISQTSLYIWVFLPLLIFFARIVDVTFGTIRVIFVSKGFRYIAPIIGFFEVIIWLLAIGQIMQNLNNFMCYIAYGAGFGTGTFVGIFLEEKLSIGVVMLRVITNRDASQLVGFLQDQNYGITCVDAIGAKGPVKVIFTIVERKHISQLITHIKQFNPNAFYTIEDIRYVKEGVFPAKPPRFFENFLKAKKK